MNFLNFIVTCHCTVTLTASHGNRCVETNVFDCNFYCFLFNMNHFPFILEFVHLLAGHFIITSIAIFKEAVQFLVWGAFAHTESVDQGLKGLDVYKLVICVMFLSRFFVKFKFCI